MSEKMTEQEIMRLEDNITSRVLSELRPSFEALGDKLESRIEKFVTKDIENIRSENNKDHARFEKYHDEHYADIKHIKEKISDQKDNLENQITQSKISTIREIADENRKQDEVITGLGSRVTAIEGEYKGKKSTMALVFSVIAAAGVIVSMFFNIVGG